MKSFQTALAIGTFLQTVFVYLGVLFESKSLNNKDAVDA